jgi:hypothetical protein
MPEAVTCACCLTPDCKSCLSQKKTRLEINIDRPFSFFNPNSKGASQLAKMRVYELARKLNLRNLDMMDRLRSMHIFVESHMSSLTDEQVTRVMASESQNTKGNPD